MLQKMRKLYAQAEIKCIKPKGKLKDWSCSLLFPKHRRHALGTKSKNQFHILVISPLTPQTKLQRDLYETKFGNLKPFLSLRIDASSLWMPNLVILLRYDENNNQTKVPFGEKLHFYEHLFHPSAVPNYSSISYKCLCCLLPRRIPFDQPFIYIQHFWTQKPAVYLISQE